VGKVIPISANRFSTAPAIAASKALQRGAVFPDPPTGCKRCGFSVAGLAFATYVSPGIRQVDGIMIRSRLRPVVIFVAAAVSSALVATVATQAAQPVRLAAHRAVYDLKLLESRGKQSLQSVRGRILYDLSGDPCQGYSLRFRQVTELDTGEGKAVISDLRQTYWEEGTGKTFRFASENKLGDDAPQSVEGSARREGERLLIDLTKPEKKRVEAADAAFPSDHMVRIIKAAQEGKTLLDVGAYDGAEDGEKFYNTLTIIGQPIAPGVGNLEVVATQKGMTEQRRWPVTISYFEKTGTGGEQTPVYSLGFEVFENGISRALKLDYGDFVLTGELTSLELREPSSCP
jgi:hypothetical protein